jgi:hypothetical protein
MERNILCDDYGINYIDDIRLHRRSGEFGIEKGGLVRGALSEYHVTISVLVSGQSSKADRQISTTSDPSHHMCMY